MLSVSKTSKYDLASCMLQFWQDSQVCLSNESQDLQLEAHYSRNIDD